MSILPVLSPTLGKRYFHNLVIYLGLFQHQCTGGFTAGRSTTRALLSFTHNCQLPLPLVILSFFLGVPHLPFLKKLAEIAMQVNPCILRWIGSYLYSYLTDCKLLSWGSLIKPFACHIWCPSRFCTWPSALPSLYRQSG